MKILHVYKDYPPVLGGIEGCVEALAIDQARCGHDVSVLVTSADRRTSVQRERGVEVIRVARWADVASTPLAPRLLWELARRRPDVTHLHHPYPPGELGQWLFGRSRATVMTYHSDIVRQKALGLMWRPLQQRALRRVDRILPTSPPYLESSSTLRPHRDRCVVVPLGVDVAAFRREDPERLARWRARFAAPCVLFVGRFRAYKGLAILLQAMRDVRAELLVVGRGVEEERLRRLARDGGVRVHWLGDVEQSDLVALYQLADLFVLPSIHRSEAFGLALLEAMASGTAVVSTELGTGTSWSNRHGETGWVVPAGDAPALRGAIQRLLAEGELRARLAAAAADRARALDRAVWTQRTLEVYHEALRHS